MVSPVDIISRHQVYLERLKTGLSNNYEKDLQKADRAISEVLKALNVERLSELNRKALTKLLSELRDAQVKIYSSAFDRLTRELTELSGSEVNFEGELLREIAAGSTAIAVAKKAEAYRRVLETPIQATGDLLEPFLKDLSARQIQRVEKEVMISVAQGRTVSQTVIAVRGTKAKNYRDGVLKRNWDDARTVIRTATQHVSSVSRVATWEANSDIMDSYQWVSTLDGRTSNQCRSLDGNVYKIGQGPMPPIHPGCRSTTVPYFKPSVWDEGATRSSKDGYVDANETYYSWLKKQPVAFQNDAIGPTRAKLLRDGGLSAEEFSALQLDRNFQPLTLEEMKKLNPNAFEKANI